MSIPRLLGSQDFDLPFTLEPGASARIALEYYGRYLPSWVWPYDQFRGFDHPPFVVRARCLDSNVSYLSFSNPALLHLPEADLSMTFNVITIVSTILAFSFGTIMTQLVKGATAAKRTAGAADDDDEGN